MMEDGKEHEFFLLRFSDGDEQWEPKSYINCRDIMKKFLKENPIISPSSYTKEARVLYSQYPGLEKQRKLEDPVEEDDLLLHGSNQRSDDPDCLVQETSDETIQEKEEIRKKISGKSGKILTIVSTRTLRSGAHNLQTSGRVSSEDVSSEIKKKEDKNKKDIAKKDEKKKKDIEKKELPGY